MMEDDGQQRLHKQLASYVQAVTRTDDGAIRASLWSPNQHGLVWVGAVLSPRLTFEAATEAATAGRLLAVPGRGGRRVLMVDYDAEPRRRVRVR